jgi:hypothetical protein
MMVRKVRKEKRNGKGEAFPKTRNRGSADGIFNPNSEVEQSDLTSSADREEVFSILACINRYALGSPQLLSASTLRQLISFIFGVRVYQRI